MRIRPLTRQDLSIVADIHAAAFWDDQISIWLYPHKEQYPNDFRDFWFRWMQFAYCQPGFRIWVVEDEETGAVLGSALWERRGKTEVARSWRKDTVGNWIERQLLNLQELYILLFGIDQSVSVPNVRRFHEIIHSAFDGIDELWHLTLLSIDPKHQRRGLGEMLLRWGLNEAAREAVPVGLEASPMGQGLYLRNGFRDYGQVDLAPDLVIPALLWEPESRKGQWGMQSTTSTTGSTSDISPSPLPPSHTRN